MTKNNKLNALSNKQKRYWKQIIAMAVKAAIAEPGSIATSYFRQLDLLVTKVKQKHPLESVDDHFGQKQRTEIEFLISNSVSKNSNYEADFFELIQLADDVGYIAHHAGDIVECRNIIKFQSGLLSVAELHRATLIMSKWIAFDLLAYSWSNSCPRCADILGFLVSMVHEQGGIDGGCVEYFGPHLTVNMFKASSPQGINFTDPPLTGLSKPIQAYRACLYSTPVEAAPAMTWTLDPAKAIKWASNHQFGDEVFPIISSIISPEEVLASFETNQELVVYPKSDRKYLVINPTSNTNSEPCVWDSV